MIVESHAISFQKKIVKELQLSIRETSNYGVILGSGTVVKGKVICEDVELMLGD